MDFTCQLIKAGKKKNISQRYSYKTPWKYWPNISAGQRIGLALHWTCFCDWPLSCSGWVGLSSVVLMLDATVRGSGSNPISFLASWLSSLKCLSAVLCSCWEHSGLCFHSMHVNVTDRPLLTHNKPIIINYFLSRLDHTSCGTLWNVPLITSESVAPRPPAEAERWQRLPIVFNLLML